MTCKDCYHFEACDYVNSNKTAEKCKYFKDKSKIIELPCKLGDTVYIITKGGFIHQRTFAGIHITTVRSIYGKTINYIIVKNDLGSRKFDMNGIGKYIFFTREEAEKALENGDRGLGT